jgi:hypothetical protein
MSDGLRFSRSTILATFKDVVGHVWKNPEWILPHIHLSEEEPVDYPPYKKVLASIAYPHKPKPWAVGDSLIRRAAQYTLRVSNDLLVLPAVEVRRILIHEAAHIGYPGHGREFRDLVVAKGGVVSGSGLDTGGVIEVQVKLGHRYKTVKTFPPEEEKQAMAWVREQVAAARSGGQEQQRWQLKW